MTAVSLLGFSVAYNVLSMCLLAVPLGFGAGTIDAAINNYVALHYKAMYMNLIHCIYGVGIMLSPYIMSIALDLHTWRFGYVSVAAIQGTIAVVSIPQCIHIYRNNSNQLVRGIADYIFRDPYNSFVEFIGSCKRCSGSWNALFVLCSWGDFTADVALPLHCFQIYQATKRSKTAVRSNSVKSFSLFKIPHRTWRGILFFCFKVLYCYCLASHGEKNI